MRTRNRISCTIRTKATKLRVNSTMKVTVKTCTQTWADQLNVYFFSRRKKMIKYFTLVWLCWLCCRSQISGFFSSTCFSSASNCFCSAAALSSKLYSDSARSNDWTSSTRTNHKHTQVQWRHRFRANLWRARGWSRQTLDSCVYMYFKLTSYLHTTISDGNKVPSSACPPGSQVEKIACPGRNLPARFGW